LDAVLRMTKLLDAPQDIPVLAPMITREIHYRLLNGEHARVVSDMAAAGGNPRSIAESIRVTKADLARAIRNPGLDRVTLMRASSAIWRRPAATCGESPKRFA